VTTAIVSDLHLGLTSGRDLLRKPAAMLALAAAIEPADELVLLGDLVELRERPIAQVMEDAAPVLRQIGEAASGKRITIVPGNHDHHLARALVESAPTLDLETVGDAPARIAQALGGDVRLAYPGVWVRDDVYATHGHYLDVHNTVPSFERLAIGISQRVTGARALTTPADYEAAVGPMNTLAYSLAQATRGGPAVGGSGASVRLWRVANGNGGRIPKLLLGGIALPAVVKAMNAAGIGPLKPDLSAIALREAGLRGMREVVERLGIEAKHVVFGHTHRSGPHPGDEGWGPLINTGSWIHEPAFVGSRGSRSPYWPGHIVLVPQGGRPQLTTLLAELP
jgi:hypothetical protein